MASASAIRAGRAFIELSLDDAKLRRGLKRAQARLRTFSASVGATGRVLSGVSLAIAAPIGLAVRIFARFDDRMRLVRAITQATEQDFANLTTEAKRLGRTTSFTTSQVADLMVELGRAGFRPDAIIASTQAILALSKVTDTELAEAGAIAAGTLRGFRLEIDQMPRVVNVLANAANGSAQTLTDLAEGLKLVTPLAVEAGDSLEETAALVAVLANNQIKGSLASSSVARAYKNLSSELGQVKLRKLGVDAVDAAGNLRPLTEILLDAGRAAAGLGEAKRLAIFEQIFGRGQAAALILGNNAEAIEELDARIRGFSSAAIAGDLDKLKDAGSRLLTQFQQDASRLPAVVNGLVAVGKKSGVAFEDLAAAMDMAGPAAVRAKRSIEDVSGAAAVLIGSGKSAAEAGRLLGLAMDAIEQPEAAAILTGLGVAATNSAGKLRPLTDVIADVVKETAGLSQADRGVVLDKLFGDGAEGAKLLAANSAAAERFAATFRSASGGVISAAADMESGVGGSFRRMFSAIEGVANAFGEATQGPMSAFADRMAGISSVITAVIEKNGELARRLVTVVAGIGLAGVSLLTLAAAARLAAFALGPFSLALKVVSIALKSLLGVGTILKVVGTLLASVAASIGGVMVAAFVGLIAVIGPVGLAIGLVAGEVVALLAVTGNLGNVLGFVATAFGQVWQAMKGAALSLIDPELINRIGQAFRGLVGDAGAGGAAIAAGFSNVVGAIGQAFSNLVGIFDVVKADALAAFDAIKIALASGDLGAAADVAWAFVKLAFTRGLDAIRECPVEKRWC